MLLEEKIKHGRRMDSPKGRIRVGLTLFHRVIGKQFPGTTVFKSDLKKAWEEALWLSKQSVSGQRE